MIDKELADKVVALGVAKRFPDEGDWWIYSLNDIGPNGQIAKLFIRDWRVAWALMEKCSGVNTVRRDGKWKSYAVKNFGVALTAGNDSMPRAIIEACCEALGDGNA